MCGFGSCLNCGVTYVFILCRLSPHCLSPLTQQPATGKCKALHDFAGEDFGELSFAAGEIIVTTEWINDEWLSGCIGDREGMFPVSFVQVLEELPQISNSKPGMGL